MLNEITKLLTIKPGLKAREIAKHTGFLRSKISVFLREEDNIFSQCSEHKWSLIDPTNIIKTLELTLSTSGWISSEIFERNLKKIGSPLLLQAHNIIIVIPKKSKILLEAISKTLALTNQLAYENKSIALRIEDPQVFSYLDRAGFFHLLNANVEVFPERPKDSRSKKYMGGNKRLVEFREINHKSSCEEITRQLNKNYLENIKNGDEVLMFTILGELIGNVNKHSESPIPGFAALQIYDKNNPRIQAVISDSGKGIAGTLEPILSEKYPELAAKYDLTKSKDRAFLVIEAFKNGKISRNGKGDGSGLHRSSESAAKVASNFAKDNRAQITVRQDNFELTFKYSSKKIIENTCKFGMPLIRGTHICFDFSLTNDTYSP
ncbi:ATP-binding protein [Cocleimonas sp. KMM 6892]|uniref:ATP-binding protein n=1 Tax=unclassified Cocleimonas TaxID=2639732 RepID=UPI002DB8FF8D|nr:MULTISPECIES: ATP-binding protein [unclassified Cocleimonas]MEB8432584.1 ATP-binding protein [Cocleimonas sp. KMM 6892]MEC4715443.1 ATP-binding protein [Cocleimonas sp. KMM 6895]MEC4744938.1 ATP-binding protein [Cocleimonas sp. KMM 6896]